MRFTKVICDGCGEEDPNVRYHRITLDQRVFDVCKTCVRKMGQAAPGLLKTNGEPSDWDDQRRPQQDG